MVLKIESFEPHWVAVCVSTGFPTYTPSSKSPRGEGMCLGWPPEETQSMAPPSMRRVAKVDLNHKYAPSLEHILIMDWGHP